MTRRLTAFLLVLIASVALLASGPAGAAASNDPELGGQWGLGDIRAPDAWAKATGRGVTVAVVSSGFGKHPDLAPKTDGGFDTTGTDATVDTGGRGTALAGIVGAATNNGEGIAGVAPDARLVPYKAFESDSSVDGEEYLAALLKAAGARPQVALVDLPDALPADARDRVRQVLKNMAASGTAVVVGAQGGSFSLAGLGVLQVAATSSAGGQVPGTASVDAQGVAAPGGGVVTTTSTPALLGADPTYGYGQVSGTSPAAAHVAGAVAILRQVGAAAPQAADLLRSTARKGDPALGAGAIDVAAAAAAYRPPAPPPTTSTTKKADPKADPSSKATGIGAIPKTTVGTGVPAGPTLSNGDPAEPGANEPAVLPPGAEDFIDSAAPRLPSEPSAGGDDRPLGALAVGFGMLCGVGTGLSVTFRRLAGSPA